jgi:acetylxylan esterase
MAATYPEMFAGGIVYSGTAAGCFYSQSGGTNAWNNSCANGQARGTPEVWAKVRTPPPPTNSPNIIMTPIPDGP